ncbi:MAG: hypothetical protein P8M30_11365 [Planctomycetaceae bacterium]|jgi:hypothetical protein|nr:hypothetical protein [Planctomycetaceae bacterium]
MTEENRPNEDSKLEESSVSDHTATAAAEPEHAEPFDDHFRPADIDQFTAEDTVAGGAIGKMLTTLFLYTIIAMSISAWWTFAQGE